jgi:hypothetical protein
MPSCLPKFIDYSQNDFFVTVELTNDQNFLREKIGHRKLMEKQGQALIKLLLNAYMELE